VQELLQRAEKEKEAEEAEEAEQGAVPRRGSGGSMKSIWKRAFVKTKTINADTKKYWTRQVYWFCTVLYCTVLCLCAIRLLIFYWTRQVYSYCTHTVLIPYSYCTPTVLVRPVA
jgi:hypothetical protein